MEGFNNVQGLDLGQAMSELAFPVSRDNAIAESYMKDVQKDAVLREDTDEVLGLISKRRPLVPYPEMMTWMVDEFDKSGIPFKLKESSLVGRGNLYQEYVFDMNIDNPDGQGIAPMVIAKGSYVGTPLKLDFGILRFVCTNGVIVGQIIESLRVKPSELRNLLRYSLREDISAGLDRMKVVSNRYNDLAQESMLRYICPFFSSDKTPMAFRKQMMEVMETQGAFKVITDKFNSEKFNLMDTDDDRVYFSHEGEALFSIEDPTYSAWDFYNVATEVATHSMRSEVARQVAYQSISHAFVA